MINGVLPVASFMFTSALAWISCSILTGPNQNFLQAVAIVACALTILYNAAMDARARWVNLVASSTVDTHLGDSVCDAVTTNLVGAERAPTVRLVVPAVMGIVPALGSPTLAEEDGVVLALQHAVQAQCKVSNSGQTVTLLLWPARRRRTSWLEKPGWAGPSCGGSRYSCSTWLYARRVKRA